MAVGKWNCRRVFGNSKRKGKVVSTFPLCAFSTAFSAPISAANSAGAQEQEHNAKVAWQIEYSP